MRKIVLPALIAAAMWPANCSAQNAPPQQPQPPQILYSKAFWGDSSGSWVNYDAATGCHLTNNCNVALTGADALPILVNPWKPVSINIQCVQIVLLTAAPPPQTYAFAGNSFSPDVLVWTVPYSGGSGDGKMCYPAGSAMPFPAAAPGAPANKPGQNNFALPHLDVHVYGAASSVGYQAYLEVWYTKNQQ